jgi:DNA-directed RNA polymerase specialized sigma24 family protein
VAALPARKRGCSAWHVAGYSDREIGARLGASDRTVERQMLRARAQVRWADRASGPVPDSMAV